ncbi:sulfur carrier protein [Evansella caseinilytica]|uniref:Sulfur carrier protein n=1 Tax=Evansella caseinilytica TaxID=1503961 RepID=A0A1H3GV15_9BACI|nr:sulfur carrier protein ThiS [Evansella caseinilytica]SDY06488.1 sulfur carrier protein [Evansella caseinilytica]
MVIQVNGKSSELPEHVTSVADLLTYYQLQKKTVIVELNEQLIDKDSHPTTSLNEGDRVELVHFVGGG